MDRRKGKEEKVGWAPGFISLLPKNTAIRTVTNTFVSRKMQMKLNQDIICHPSAWHSFSNVAQPCRKQASPKMLEGRDKKIWWSHENPAILSLAIYPKTHLWHWNYCCPLLASHRYDMEVMRHTDECACIYIVWQWRYWDTPMSVHDMEVRRHTEECVHPHLRWFTASKSKELNIHCTQHCHFGF